MEMVTLSSLIAQANNRMLLLSDDLLLSPNGLKAMAYINDATLLVQQIAADPKFGSLAYAPEPENAVAVPEDAKKSNLAMARIRTEQATAASRLF